MPLQLAFLFKHGPGLSATRRCYIYINLYYHQLVSTGSQFPILPCTWEKQPKSFANILWGLLKAALAPGHGETRASDPLVRQ